MIRLINKVNIIIKVTQLQLWYNYIHAINIIVDYTNKQNNKLYLLKYYRTARLNYIYTINNVVTYNSKQNNKLYLLNYYITIKIYIYMYSAFNNNNNNNTSIQLC